MFCGRFDLLSAFTTALADPGHRILAVYTENDSDQIKFGKTRLLNELTVRALGAGHVLCVMSFTRDQDPQRNLRPRLPERAFPGRPHVPLRRPSEGCLERGLRAQEGSLDGPRAERVQRRRRPARYLDGLVSARYGVEIALSQRRIELVYRLGQDRHHLESFLERHEQLAVIERLLAPDSTCWAAHLIGMGGVGKTMLLRHVTVTQADHHRSIVARVDFDHLNPDFPVRRPGQLLAALAEELASVLDGERQQSLLISFHGYVAEINEQLSAEPPPDDPLGNLRHPLFQRILDAFGDLLTSLPLPPLFILDTCEELAKIDPVSAKIPGVEAMFYILHTPIGPALQGALSRPPAPRR